MKKTIQINIAGIVFNIEEDAYENLQAYLKSIQKYFSTFEGSLEIYTDIESRIAEKFLNLQKVDNSTVITNAEVDAIMVSMGTVSDFEAIEDDVNYAAIDDKSKTIAAEPKTQNVSSSSEKTNAQSAENTNSGPKRLFRDEKRKALGGVLAGMANYFSIDVVWIRVIFLVFFLGLSPLTETGASGVFFIAYLICWVAIPASMLLEDDNKIKKFYRDPEDKVLGGVCGGLSSYFGIDVAIIRIIFGVGLFVFGVGFMAYIILWITAPTANTLTQKMEMKGEPVTLENIETNIKNSLNIDPKIESGISKVILFPFRVLSTLLKGLGQLFKKLGPVTRIFSGVLLLIIGFAMLIGVIISTGLFFGVVSNPEWFDNSNFFGFITQDFPPIGGMFAFFALGTPALAISIVGASLVSNNKLGTRNFWLTTLALWFIGIMGLGAVGTKYALNFSKRAHIEEVSVIKPNSSVLFLDMNEMDEDFDARFDADVEIEGTTGTEIEIIKKFYANGSSIIKAKGFAKKIEYSIIQKDSMLLFDERPNLTGIKTPFRDQEVNVLVKIPVNQKFKMSKRFAYELLNNYDDISNNYEVFEDNVDKFTFIINDKKEIECLDCPKLSEEERNSLQDDSEFGTFVDNSDFEHNDSPSTVRNLSNFNSLEISDAFIVTVRQGTEHKVQLFSDDNSNLKEVETEVSNGVLMIEFEDSFSSNRGAVYVEITMPDIKQIAISGAVIAKVVGFDKVNKLDMDLSGASKIAIDAEIENLKIDLSGASKLETAGKVQNLDLEISGASKFNSTKMKIYKAKISASGASKAKIGKIESLFEETSGASEIVKD